MGQMPQPTRGHEFTVCSVLGELALLRPSDQLLDRDRESRPEVDERQQEARQAG